MSGNVTYEGVTFVVAACSKMTKEEFTKAHVEVFWPDKDIKTRRKMLAEVYTLIVPQAATEKKD